MSPGGELRFWRLAWPEIALLFLLFLAVAVALVWHIMHGGGTLYQFGEVCMPESTWDLLWVRGVYSQPTEWWHGIGATIRDVTILLAVVFYLPFRWVYWAKARFTKNMRGT